MSLRNQELEDDVSKTLLLRDGKESDVKETDDECQALRNHKPTIVQHSSSTLDS